MTAVDEQPPRARWTGLSRSAAGDPVPTAVERARSRLTGLGWQDRMAGWLAPLALTMLAFGLRIYRLGTPHRFAFDETYYAKDGWSLLNNGYVAGYKDDVDGNDQNEIDDDILAGNTVDLWTGDPSMTVHPDVGKWLIGLGEQAFGMDPVGWRISAAVAGALMVLVVCRLVRRLTGSTMLGCLAGLLVMLDGMHFVLSRLALLDIFLALFLTCAVHCVVADRQWLRRRLARWAERPGSRYAPHVAAGCATGTAEEEPGSRGSAAGGLAPRPPDGGAAPGSSNEPAGAADGEDSSAEPPAMGWGPVRAVLLRPWLLAGGVCFGLAAGTKWTAVYPLAAFGLLCWLWSAGARRSFGIRWAVAKGALVDGVPAFFSLVVVGALVYVATWGGWLAHASDYEEHLSATQYRQFTGEGHCAEDDDSFVATNLDESRRWPTATEKDAEGLGEAWQSLRSLWYYHQDVYTFHTHFLNCSEHTYASKPSSWLLVNRPVGVAVTNDIKPGVDGCDAPEGSDCIRQVLLIPTPVLWWGGVVALLFSVVMWLGARDWRYGVAVVGALSTWLPWLQYDDRPIFLFYAIAILPFVVVALTLSIGTMIGPSRAPSSRRTLGVIVGGAFVVLTLVNHAWFWPIWTNGLLTHSEWLDRVWFSRWI